jgi:hypothetical protein
MFLFSRESYAELAIISVSRGFEGLARLEGHDGPSFVHLDSSTELYDVADSAEGNNFKVSAYQTSEFHPLQFSSNGGGNIVLQSGIFPDRMRLLAKSFFDVSFSIDTSYVAHLHGGPYATGEDFPGYANITLTGPATDLHYQQNTGGDFDFVGNLDVGEYHLTADAGVETLTSGPRMGFGAYSLTFDLQEIPEHSTLVLLGMGAIGVLAFIRQRKKT